MGDIEDGVHEVFLRKIAEHCPNVAIRHVYLDQDSTNISGILGPQIRNLFLHDGLESRFADLRISVSKKCFNVSDLTIGLKNAEEFFAEPKPELETLCLRDVMNKHTYEDILRIANNLVGFEK